MFLNTDYQHKQQCTCHGAIDQLYGVSVVVYDKTSMSEFMQYSLLTLFTNLIRVHGWRRLVWDDYTKQSRKITMHIHVSYVINLTISLEISLLLNKRNAVINGYSLTKMS